MSRTDLNLINGKAFILLLMSTAPDGQEDWAVVSGTARIEPGGVYLDRGAKPRFDIRAEWISRIRPVAPELRSTLLGADYYLPLTVASLGTDPDDEDLVLTGLKWPE